jgi:ferredoxin-NADP reductase
VTLSWQPASVVALRRETETARTIVLRIPSWRGHVAGQHLDVRLTAADGYTAVRSYSIASSAAAAGSAGAHDVELTIEQVEDGEVSPYLATMLSVGNQVEVRGPIGAWFVWRPEQQESIQLIAGGSGIVPLMAMVRAARPLVADRQIRPMRLLYSVRSPATAVYADELRRLHSADLLELTMVYTRGAPEGWPGRVGRLADAELALACWPPDTEPTSYVCGPSPFVEVAAAGLVRLGHDPDRIRTERFGSG